MVLLNESRNEPVSNIWNPVVLLFWFGSYEQFHNNSHRNQWFPVYVILLINRIWRSIVPTNGAAWSAIGETRWRILLLWFSCNIFYYDQIKLSWYSRYTFSSCSVVVCFTAKKYLVTPDVFRGRWVGWTENIILTFCVTNWVWTLPLSKKTSLTSTVRFS